MQPKPVPGPEDADEDFEIIYANNDIEVMEEAESYETIHGIVFNLFEADDDYNEI